MDFETEYGRFLRFHTTRRKGERRRRLRENHGHAEQVFAENVWWPLFHGFDGLHPEYEISDYKDGYRYLDFAYIQSHFRMAVEIDGYGPHLRNVSRWKFADNLQRQNDLVVDGWHVLRFSFDAIQDRPRKCQQTIQLLLARLRSDSTAEGLASLESANQREIIRLLMRTERPVTPGEVSGLLGIGQRAACHLLHRLAQLRWLEGAGGTVRIRSYQLHPSRSQLQI